MSLHTHFSVEDLSRLSEPLSVGRSALRAHKPRTVRGWIGHAVRTIALWADRAEQRRDLAELDEPLLRDIGKTREEARRESEKPFWVR